MDEMFDITIAVLTKNSENTLRQCLNSIFHKKDGSNSVQLLLLDNGSIDDTLSKFQIIMELFIIRFLI